jgi:predicted lysophospholipase L1 biosynthesis ABC-type transport system permease subunit
VFIGAAVRFGAESRDRQQAALRLVGADRSMTRRIAAGEALVGALLGLVAGAALFLAGRQLIELVTLEDLSVFASDVRPDPVLVALIAVLVPVSAVAVSVLALRRVVVEPLGVVRRATAVKRRLWWRLVVPAVGIGLLVPLLGGIRAGGERFSTLQVGTGVTLLLVGVAVLLPWLVEAVVRRLGGGGVAWQLAIRRLQLTSGSAARVVSGIAVAVAGAVGLLTLFAGVQHAYQQPTHQDPTRAQVDVNVPRTLSLAQAHELTGRFAATPGVRSVFGVSRTEIGATQVGADGYRDQWTLIVGDCATLRQLATIGGCADGDTFLATAPGAGDSATPRPGTPAAVLSGNAEHVTGSWTVPATARTVRARTAPDGSSQLGVLATRSAVDARLLGQLRETVYVRVDPSRPDTLERVRNVAAAADPLSTVLELTASRTDGTLVTIEHGILGGATAVLLLIGASMLVTVLEQLRERRRLLAVLTAFGTRRGTLTASVLWQTAVPVFLGLLLAVVGGVLLGAVLLRMTSEPVSFAWAQIGEIAGVAAAVVLLVTVLSMPALWRLMRPEGMRTE